MAEHRIVKQYTDRGSIKDIQQRVNDSLEEDPQLPPTQDELRIKEIYQQAMVTRDQALLDSLGMIVMTGPATDPVALYRHREYVRTLSTKFADQITESAEELTQCFPEPSEVPRELRTTGYKQIMSRQAIMNTSGNILVKTASSDGVEHTGPRYNSSFRRAVR